RVIGAIEKRVLAAYGRALWPFLHHRWVSALIWVACMAGTVWLFIHVPKAFLPVGDSSFVRGVMIAQEGSSPAQMHAYQSKAEAVMQRNPAVDMTFSMTGNSGFLSGNMGFLLAFLKDPDQRPPIQQVAGQLMDGIAGST